MKKDKERTYPNKMGTEAATWSIRERVLKGPDIDKMETHEWLKCSGLETEGLIIAARDEV